MKTEMLISVIVPVYNGERFLRRSLDSILGQTYKNIEVVLLNDGSTDGTDAICREYAARDSRVSYYSHENQGVARTRYRGFELAKGEFIACVDADDYILPTMLESMFEQLCIDGTDIAVCQWNYEFNDGRVAWPESFYTQFSHQLMSGAEFARYYYKPYPTDDVQSKGYNVITVGVLWNKLYRKVLLKNYESSYKRMEDEDMNDNVLSKGDIKISIVPGMFYMYCQNDDSLSVEKFQECDWQYVDVLWKRVSRFNDKSIKAETCKLLSNICIEFYYKSIQKDIKIPSGAKRIFIKSCAKLIRLGYLNPKFHIRMALFNLSPTLYKKLI